MDTIHSHGSAEHGMQIDASVVTQLLLPRGSRCFDVCCCCHGNAPLASDALRSNFLFFFASIDVRVLRGDIVQENDDDDDDDDDDDVALLLTVLPAGLSWILLRGTLVVVAVAVVVVAVAVVLILDTGLDFVLTMDAVCVETRPKRDEAPSVAISTLPHFAASFFRRSSYMARSCRQGHARGHNDVSVWKLCEQPAPNKNWCHTHRNGAR
jgi:hypothetical protein